jgi:hypothetical protein
MVPQIQFSRLPGKGPDWPMLAHLLGARISLLLSGPLGCCDWQPHWVVGAALPGGPAAWEGTEGLGAQK